jgi:polysaccharide pyruvyl transferase WcaK-like protein
LGDDAVYEAATRLLAGCRIERYVAVSKERRLRKLGLSGGGYFSHYVLGGGTVINDQAVRLARQAILDGIPAWTLGSGAGGAGFNTPHSPDLSEWRAMLPRFKALGVRGPRSLGLLRGLGAHHAEVVGDLALGLTPNVCPTAPPGRRYAVNVMSGPEDGSEPWFDDLLHHVQALIRRLDEKGWRPVFVSLCPIDVPAANAVMKATNHAAEPLRCPTSAQEFFDLIGTCEFIVATRLHAAVLATCVGTQPIAVAYRDKVHDFMDSMELSETSVGVPRIAGLGDLASALTNGNGVRRATLWERARAFRSTLERFTREQLRA